jgi:DNA invertase Pin-like site-specific DNA recombinase
MLHRETDMNTHRFVSYIRVSTKRQGASGLGLEAQAQAVADYVAAVDGELVEQFCEVESGTKNDRPALAEAISCAKRNKAVLLIARLDRLSRNAGFLLTLQGELQRAGVDFKAVDLPNADWFMLGVMALVAQRERELISSRTRGALAAAKARGVRLGNPRAADAAVKSRAVRTAKATQKAENIAPIVASIRAAGVTSLRGVADALTARGIPSPSGGRWYAASVQRVLARV